MKEKQADLTPLGGILFKYFGGVLLDYYLHKIRQLSSRRGKYSISVDEIFEVLTDITLKQRETIEGGAISMTYLDFDVPTKVQLTKPTIKNPNTGEVITLQKGHSCKVLDQLDPHGRAYIYQYDGENWNRTPYTTFPDDVVLKS